MKKLFAFMMMAVLLLGSVQIVSATEPKDKPLIIVIDPGHDLTHGGARSEYADGSALSETKLNMKIAQYCYDELSTYSNVQVYLVRHDNGCPFPECEAMDNGAGADNRKRVDFAWNLDADAYVALHLNSYGSSDVNGASVMVPDKSISYKKDVAKEAYALGDSIQKELIDLGLKDKKLQTRRSENGTKYENGDIADYYGVIKRARELGIAGIIVEHCFISSPSDVANYLTTEEQLKSLGVADATGIAKYYGLTKDGNTVAPDPLHKVEFYKNGTLVSTEYVRHGDSAMGLDAEYMEITNVTYNKSLSNITGDTNIEVSYSTASSNPAPTPTPSESEEPDNSQQTTESESQVTTETETESGTGSESESELNTETNTESDTEDVTEDKTETDSQETQNSEEENQPTGGTPAKGLKTIWWILILCVVAAAAFAAGYTLDKNRRR